MHEFELCSGLVLKFFLQLPAGHLGWGVKVPCCCGEPHHFLVCYWSHRLVCYSYSH